MTKDEKIIKLSKSSDLYEAKQFFEKAGDMNIQFFLGDGEWHNFLFSFDNFINQLNEGVSFRIRPKEYDESEKRAIEIYQKMRKYWSFPGKFGNDDAINKYTNRHELFDLVIIINANAKTKLNILENRIEWEIKNDGNIPQSAENIRVTGIPYNPIQPHSLIAALQKSILAVLESEEKSDV